MRKDLSPNCVLLIQIDFSNGYKLETSCELKYIVLNISYVLLYFDAWYNKTKEKKILQLVFVAFQNLICTFKCNIMYLVQISMEDANI